MTQNNYDQSSTGINIESRCHYDNWLSQEYFNENFEKIKGDSAWFYTDCRQLNDDSLSEFKTSGKIKDYERLCEYNFISIERADYDNASDYKIDVVQELVALEGFRNAVKEASGFNIKLDFKNDIRMIEIRGYSQGDYAEVYADFTQIESLWGKIPSESELKELFTNYFYDAPIACRVTINNEEYNIYGMPCFKSEYEFQREEFIGYIVESYKKDMISKGAMFDENSKSLNYIKNQLEAMLPDSPNYE